MPYGQPPMQQQQPQAMMPMQGMPMMQQQPQMMPMQQQMQPMGYPMMQPQPQFGVYSGMAVGGGGGGQGAGGQTDMVTMQFTGQKLEDHDCFGRSDPYFTISKTMGSGHFAEVVRSTVVKNSLNPSWPPITISVSELCGGDYDRQLKIEVLDHDDSGKNDMIGSFTTTLNMLKASQGAGNQKFQLVNPKKQNRLMYKNSGTIHLGQFSIQKKQF